MGRFLENFDGRFVVFCLLVSLVRDGRTACLDRHLSFFEFDIVFIEFFAHEHVLLGNVAVYFDAIGIVFFFQLFC
jgi:hypothetical protein